jgi:hypothetical protein
MCFRLNITTEKVFTKRRKQTQEGRGTNPKARSSNNNLDLSKYVARTHQRNICWFRDIFFLM